MHTIFYDDQAPRERLPCSIFLAGPTANGIRRTPWRQEALNLLAEQSFTGMVILPEFRNGLFAELAPVRFGRTSWPQEPSSLGDGVDTPAAAGMRTVSYNILAWETAGIELSTLVLFWMPFRLGAPDDPTSLPGFTTRAEVSREIARDSSRIVLGMPHDALSSSHIRFHAHQKNLTILPTLRETIRAACLRLDPIVCPVHGQVLRSETYEGESGGLGHTGCWQSVQQGDSRRP